MQNYSNQTLSEDVYVSKDDESEVKQLQRLVPEGFGEMILLDDEEVKKYSMNDFGIGIG